MLREIIAPALDWEFGLLESLQHLLILATLFIALRALPHRDTRVEKAVFLVTAFLMAFLFLEEIDYGCHYYDYFMGLRRAADDHLRNIHNIGSMTQYFKFIADGVLVVWFVVLPLVLRQPRQPLVRYLLPPGWFATSVVAMLVTASIAHLANRSSLQVRTLCRTVCPSLGRCSSATSSRCTCTWSPHIGGTTRTRSPPLPGRIQREIDVFHRPEIEAIVAAAEQRFRPISLATATTALGLLPLWIGGGEMSQPRGERASQPRFLEGRPPFLPSFRT